MKSICLLVAVLSCLTAGLCASAQQATPKIHFVQPRETTSTYTVETILQGLDHPGSLTIRPGGPENVAAELYLAEKGSGRILKMSTAAPGVMKEVIVGFPVMDFESVPISEIPEGSLPDQNLQGQGRLGKGGLLGLLFLTHNKLVVHYQLEDGQLGNESHLEVGDQSLDVYRLPTEDVVLSADQTDHRAESITIGSVTIGDPSSGNWPQAGRGYYGGLAKNGKTLFIASNGKYQGRILKATLVANRLKDLRPLIAATKKTGLDTTQQAGLSGPTSITINPKSGFQYLVVGQMGHFGGTRDSRLAFYSPKSGRLAMNISTGLHDLVDLSYSPEGTLYGIDLAWQVETDGGIYRLDDTLLAGKPSCQAIKIAPAHHPTSLVFAPDGSLYVTTWGPASAEVNAKSKQKMGALLRITGKW